MCLKHLLKNDNEFRLQRRFLLLQFGDTPFDMEVLDRTE